MLSATFATRTETYPAGNQQRLIITVSFNIGIITVTGPLYTWDTSSQSCDAAVPLFRAESAITERSDWRWLLNNQKVTEEQPAEPAA